MTRPAEVTSPHDWADLVAALRNLIDLIEGLRDGFGGEADAKDKTEPEKATEPQKAAEPQQVTEPQVAAASEMATEPGPDREQPNDLQEEPMTDDDRDRDAQLEEERRVREDFESDGRLDGDTDPDPQPDPGYDDPDLEA
jgi:hypothetical protein